MINGSSKSVINLKRIIKKCKCIYDSIITTPDFNRIGTSQKTNVIHVPNISTDRMFSRTNTLNQWKRCLQSQRAFFTTSTSNLCIFKKFEQDVILKYIIMVKEVLRTAGEIYQYTQYFLWPKGTDGCHCGCPFKGKSIANWLNKRLVKRSWWKPKGFPYWRWVLKLSLCLWHHFAGIFKRNGSEPFEILTKYTTNSVKRIFHQVCLQALSVLTILSW